MPLVDLDELAQAMDWVSSSIAFDNAAYVSRETGQVFWVGDAVDEPDDFPEDIEDGTKFVAVPSKQDLDLGRALAIDFVEKNLPSALAEVHAAFRREGAYRRFKGRLERAGLLDAWFAFEAAATKHALESWAVAQGLQLRSSNGRNDA
jgi:hypothetical protein